MTEVEQVLYGRSAGASRITINRPEQRNAMNRRVLEELVQAVKRGNADSATSCIVLSGAGDRAFCAGADLKEIGAADDALAAHRGRGQLARLFEALWAADKPTIARVDGHCLAGGFGVALACDIVLATPTSQFGTPEVKVGLWPYMITLPMIRSMPPKQALRLMMTGERVNADRGRELGFVSEIVSREQIDERVSELAATFAEASPQAIALGRRAFYSVVDHDPNARLETLHASLGVHLTMPDAAEGIAAFAEKRAPRWQAATESHAD